MKLKASKRLAGWAVCAGYLAVAACGGATPPPSEPKVAEPTTPEEAAPAEVGESPDTEPDATAPEPVEEPIAESEEEVVDPGPAGPFTPSPGKGPLELRITISPGDDLTVAEAEDFELNISVKNPTRHAINPDLHNSELMVNGKRLKYWQETVAELPQAGSWVDLGKNRKVEFVFKVADKVKVKPGDYVFVLRAANSESPSVRLHVRP